MLLATVGADASSEPGLRLARTLSEPHPATADEAERALLRTEWLAKRTGADEQDIVGDIIARITRMDRAVADIQLAIQSWPTQPGPSPRGPADTASRDVDDKADDGFVLPMALKIAAMLLLIGAAWLYTRRAAYFRTQRRRLAAAAVAAETVTLPPPAIAGDPPAAAVLAPGPAERRSARLIRAANKAGAGEPVRPEPPAPAVSGLSVSEPVAPAPAGAVPSAPEPAAPAIAPPPAMSAVPAGIAGFGRHAPIASSGAQALELADIMLSMGLVHGAAQALTDQIRDNPRLALYHWLKLLDVYQRSGMRADFEHAATELRQYFNVQAEDWQAGSAGDYHSISDFPHLVGRLQALWPTPDCAAFLTELIEDTRGGTRSGFPQQIAEEILLLQRVLEELAPG